MNLTELGKALAAIGVPAQLVALGGHTDLALRVERAGEGRWEGFWCEQGIKNSLVYLKTASQLSAELVEWARKTGFGQFSTGSFERKHSFSVVRDEKSASPSEADQIASWS